MKLRAGLFYAPFRRKEVVNGLKRWRKLLFYTLLSFVLSKIGHEDSKVLIDLTEDILAVD